MSYDKDVVKENIEIEDIFDILEYFQAEPQLLDNKIICKTVCHDGDSHKLYYYEEQKLFKCYTQCGDAFDIFSLISKIKDIDLNESVLFVVNYFNLQHKIEEVEDSSLSEDWQILKKYDKILNIEIKNEKLELPELNKNLLEHMPQPRILNWEREYITKEVCDYMNIRYNPVNGTILIPHYDENNRLIGIRQRTLVQEDEKYGKYRPTKLQGQMCNHPLGWNLYGLNISKSRIKEMGVAIVAESEKAVLQGMSYLGTENNVVVGMCGSSLSNYQFHLLLDAGAKEICIAVDADFHKINDEEYNKVIEKMEKMCNKYSISCNLSFMLDLQGLTGYKCSPTDKGREVFLELWRNRLVV